MTFANAFDAAMAAAGPPALFVRNDEGEWRVDAVLTRDAWERVSAPPERDPAWALVRDRATGFVALWFTTGRGLLAEHPRAELRLFGEEAEAAAALAALGRPPLSGPWDGA